MSANVSLSEVYKNLIRLDKCIEKKLISEKQGIQNMVDYLIRCVEERVNMKACIEPVNEDTLLHKAIREGKVHIISALDQSQVADWNKKNAGDSTPRELIEKRYPNLKHLLKPQPANPTPAPVPVPKPTNPAPAPVSEQVLSPFGIAVQENDTKTMLKCYWKGAKLDVRIDSKENTLQHMAADRGYFEALMVLINLRPQSNDIEFNLEQDTPLHLAVKKNHVATTYAILSCDYLTYSLTHFNKDGLSPLDIAVENEHLGIVKMLLTHCKIWLNSKILEKAKKIAQSKQNPSLIALLNDKDFKIKNPSYQEIQNADPFKFNQYLKEGLNVNQLNEKGYSLLHQAIIEKNIALAKFLMSTAGGDARLKDGQKYTSLDLAASRGLEELIDYIQSTFYFAIGLCEKGEYNPAHLAERAGYQRLGSRLRNQGWG